MVWISHRTDWIDNSEYSRRTLFRFDVFDLFGNMEAAEVISFRHSSILSNLTKSSIWCIGENN